MCDSILIKNFFLQLFDIGRSAGSLITEALGLFRTFQKLTASNTFTMRFSEESLKMFKWAIDIFELIRHKFFFRPFDDYDFFYLYSCIIPLMLMTFISALLSGYSFYSYLLGYGMIFMLGTGLCFIGIDMIWAITFSSCGVLYIVIALGCGCVFPSIRFLTKKGEYDENEERKNMDCWCTYCGFCCCKCNSKYNAIQFTYSLSKSLLLMTIFLMPILQGSYKLTVLYGLVVLGILVISIIIESIVALVKYIKKHVDFDELTNVPKFIDLCLSFFSLLIIPSTEHFMNLVTGKFYNNWRLITCYIFYSLIVPLGLTIIMIAMRFDSILGKYKDYKIAFVYFFELGEIVRQIAYAICASYDISYACIGLEVAWIVLVFACRPFQNKSDYFLQLGSSAILIIELAVCIAHEKKGSGFLSFSLTCFLLFLACIPAVGALYVYFIFDFTINEDDDDQEDEKKEDEVKAYKLGMIIRVVSPVAWLFLPFLFFFYYFRELQPKGYMR